MKLLLAFLLATQITTTGSATTVIKTGPVTVASSYSTKSKKLNTLAKIPVVKHTEADTKMLGDVMWLENGHTGLNDDDNKQCLILTGAVVLNRVRSGEWGGRTVEKVIYAKGQYASHTRNNIGKTDTPQWVYDLAEEILTYGTNVPEYVVFQSMQPKLGKVWKVIENGRSDEYFACNVKGHYLEGSEVHVETNRKLYLRQSFNEFKQIVSESIQTALKELHEELNPVAVG